MAPFFSFNDMGQEVNRRVPTLRPQFRRMPLDPTLLQTDIYSGEPNAPVTDHQIQIPSCYRERLMGMQAEDAS